MAPRVHGMSRKRWVLRIAHMNRKQERMFSRLSGAASPSNGAEVRRLRPRDGLESFLLRSGADSKGESGDIFDLGLPSLRRLRARDAQSILPWLVQLGQLGAGADSRRGLGRRLLLGPDLLGGVPSEPLPCGLQQEQAFDLMSRDLTPEDYEMLSKLDDGVAKKNTAEKDLVDQLPRVAAAACEAKECGVCLMEFEAKTEAVRLPCKHSYHPECISKWLTQCKNACPMCSAPIHRPAVVEQQA